MTRLSRYSLSFPRRRESSMVLCAVLFLALLVLPTLVLADTATVDNPQPQSDSTVFTDFPQIGPFKPLPVYGEGGKGPIAIIVNLYYFALGIGGLLAFAMILWGAIKYMTAGGSHSSLDEAKEIITEAFLGLLLLVGAYLVLTVVNPDLTNLQLPFLERLKEPELSEGAFNVTDDNGEWELILDSSITKPISKGCFPTEEVCKKHKSDNMSVFAKIVELGPTFSADCKVTDACKAKMSDSGTKDCKGNQAKYNHPNACLPAPMTKEIVDCAQDALISENTGKVILDTGLGHGPSPSSVATGNHSSINSCHFGGPNCADGGHAIDYGINTSKTYNLSQVTAIVSACKQQTSIPVSCYYENSSPDKSKGETIRKDENGQDYKWNDPRVNHAHCNVNTASCGCK